MSTETSAPKSDIFKILVIVLLTLISIFAALITFLQSYASLQSGDLVKQSQVAAVNSTGFSFEAGLEAAQGMDVQQRFADYVQRAVRADTKARALRMGGGDSQIALAAEYALDAERWRRAAETVRQSNPLLNDYGQATTRYREELSRPAYLEAERQHNFLEQSRAWSQKANGYVAILSTLSVSLFLAGLSLTISSRVRYLLASAGVGLTFICFVWLAFVLFSPVPRITDEAIQRFVDGQVKYNVDNAQGVDAVDAIADFEAAIDLAPSYARAYFYRSLANTDSRLTDLHLDKGQAIADGERALRLGIETSPVYGNLGWLYYLNGQYNSALAATETALRLAPDECYLTFNHGLILAALERLSDAERIYSEEAIPCALNQSEYLRNYYLDVGVIDLEDLVFARPDLESSIRPSVVRLKEAAASLQLFGSAAQDLDALLAATQPRPTTARLGPLTFGETVDDTNHIADPQTEFPNTIVTVYATFDFLNMTPDTRWLERWLLDGREYLVLDYDQWDQGEAGTGWIGITNAGGLPSGHYTVDVFAEGNLITSGEFTVLAGNMPVMGSYDSTGVAVTINYPLTWNITDLCDNEVCVVAARDPDHPTFFGVTSWVASTNTDQDVHDLFNGYFGAGREAFDDFASEAEEPFTVAELDGWLSYYTYTDTDGTPIQGAMVGVLDAQTQLVYLLAAETHYDEWESNLELLNVMLSRIDIGQ